MVEQVIVMLKRNNNSLIFVILSTVIFFGALSCSHTGSKLCCVDEEITYLAPSPLDMSDSLVLLTTVENASYMVDAGDYLLTLTRDKTHYINIIDKSNGASLLKCGSIGRGPNEFLNIPGSDKWSVTNESGDLILFLSNYDFIGAFNLSRSLKEGHAVFEEIRKKRDYLPKNELSYTWINPFPMKDFTFVCAGLSYKDPRDGFIDPPISRMVSDSRVKDYRIFPHFDKGSKNSSAISYYQGVERVSKDGSMAVLASTLLDASVILDLKTGHSLLVRESSSLFLDDLSGFTDYDLRKVLTATSLDVDAGSRYFVQLFCGILAVDFDEGQSWNSLIRIWDYKGNLIANLMTGLSSLRIAFAESEGKVYLLDEEGNIYYLDVSGFIQ